jgi:hypothetical protein
MDGLSILAVLSEGREKLGVLLLRTNRNTNTVVTENHTITVTNDNTLLHEIAVNLVCALHLDKEEVGVRRINLNAYRKNGERINECLSFIKDE